jgi:hypothetical protein
MRSVGHTPLKPGSTERSSKGLLRSGVRSRHGERAMPMKSGHRKSDNPTRTTHGSVLASIERPAQAKADVTRFAAFPDESIPHGHLGCGRAEEPRTWSSDIRHPA